MMKILALFFALLALPAFAAEPVKQPDPDALILKHSEQEVANNPAVKAAQQQVGTAFGNDSSAKNDRAQTNQQIIAATEKYREESRQAQVRTPEEYQKFIESHQQRFDNLNNNLRSTSGFEKQNHKQLEETRKQLRLVTMEARVDNPAFPVYITEGTSWQDEAGGRLAQRVLLRDSSGKRYALTTPQPVDKLSNPNCAYYPIWGELWAVRGAEITPLDPKAPANTPVQLKIASLKQVYLLDHAAAATCPFGQVLVPAPKQP
jgi:flagellar biosynthesis GTPase FlhF